MLCATPYGSRDDKHKGWRRGDEGRDLKTLIRAENDRGKDWGHSSFEYQSASKEDIVQTCLSFHHPACLIIVFNDSCWGRDIKVIVVAGVVVVLVVVEMVVIVEMVVMVINYNSCGDCSDAVVVGGGIIDHRGEGSSDGGGDGSNDYRVEGSSDIGDDDSDIGDDGGGEVVLMVVAMVVMVMVIGVVMVW
ncbi:hypothetical protein PoB_003373300 [Plakobranchus ocellatus]|uniref:Uncharacterized protein n=1 Tax=Plakobranchus ocellatus TaxID=259542 RepID=A0AAV4AL13_9GAST|nr:hypothetical protein PoB_003373300 [Plakobranchus ocellatus]